MSPFTVAVIPAPHHLSLSERTAVARGEPWPVRLVELPGEQDGRSLEMDDVDLQAIVGFFRVLNEWYEEGHQ